MKKIVFTLMLGCVVQCFVEAQSVPQVSPATTNAPAVKVAPTVVARSANSRIWARITSQTNAAGKVSTVTNNAYTELGSGLCFLKDGEWVDANPTIKIVEDGASAKETQHKVHFAGNANKAGGAVHLVAPDGKVFDSRVYGLAYWDSVSGKSVLLAPLQDCQGTLVGTNRVIYTNAFKGVNADLEYVLTRAGLEQNVILRGPIPSPDSVGEGLAAASSRLEVLTEFFSPEAPKKKKSRVMGGVAEDTSVNFGAMGIGMGKAFSIPGEGGTNGVNLGRVSKHWMRLDARDFLIEELPYKAISNAVQKLPGHASAGPVGASVKGLASLEPLLPREVASSGPPVAMRLAQSMPERPGVVVDYQEFDYADISTNIVFQSDTTYYINGSLTLAQAPVFEGGTVLKFNSSYNDPALQNYGDSLCSFNGSAYRPVVCTSCDDDSVGDIIAGSSGNPVPGRYGTYIYEGGGGGSNVTVVNVRFCYAGTAYEDDNDTSHLFEDCQFVLCSTNAVCLPDDTDLYLYNDLFTGCGSVVFRGWSGSGVLTLHAVNITADAIGQFDRNYWGYDAGGITNSILTDCDSSISNFTIDCTCVVKGSGAGIYEAVGDGHFYLSPDTCQGEGTINIDSWLLADLQAKTTWPPVVYASQTISGPMNLGMAVPREEGFTGVVDPGYHYAPLDYVFGGTTVGGNLTFSSGVVVGWYNDGSGYGILMSNTTIASFEGTATAPDWWVRCNTVQESGGSTTWPGHGAAGGLVGADTGNISQSPQASLLFTHCSILGGGDGGGLSHFADDGGYLILNAEHSEFYGGMIGGSAISCHFTNCLMDRVAGGQYRGLAGNQWIMTNCTWHGGVLDLSPNYTAIPIRVRDCAFDGTQLIVSAYGANAGYANYDYNAFTNTAGKFPIGGTHDQIVSDGFNWQSSWFGNYYLPSDSPLIGRGNVTANLVGLYHFTTQVGGAPQGDSQVDIGYHYVATDAYGNPLNTVGGPLPDYLADARGDGLFDPGDPYNWLINPYNGLTFPSGLQVFTPLK